jgi:hypothetical protein
VPNRLSIGFYPLKYPKLGVLGPSFALKLGMKFLKIRMKIAHRKPKQEKEERGDQTGFVI